MKKSTLFILIALIAGLLIGYGMARQKPALPDGDKDDGEAGEVTEEGPIKIGFIGPLTGEAASAGEPGQAGAEFSVRELNDAGGVLGRNIELVIEDDKCSADGVNAMNKLVNIDKVIAVTGPDCSASGGPALPIAQSAGVPVIVRWASAPNLTKIGDYIFRVYPSDSLQGQFAAEFFFNTLGKKKAAVVYVKNDWGEGLQQVFNARFKELGGEVVYNEGVSQDSTDLRTQLTKIKNTDSDVLYFPVYAANGVAGLKQAQELGLTIPIMGGDIFETDEIIKSVGAEGILYTVAVIQNKEDFQKKVQEITGKKADKITAPMAYDAIKIIAQAIERAGSLDRKTIRDEIAKTSYQGVSSPLIEFDENGDLKSGQFEVKVIKNNIAVPYSQK